MPPFDPFRLPLQFDPLKLPIGFELSAVFLFAVTGALLAVQKRYDVVGVFVLATLSATGGGLVRAFLLQRVPQVLEDERYLYVIGGATLVCLIAGTHLNRFKVVFLLADALGLAIYAVVGTQRGLDAGLHFVPAGFVGLANAIGGSLLRDVLTGEERLLFQPGEFYVMAAVGGVSVFLGVAAWTDLPPQEAAWCSIATTFLLRLASIRFNWKTRAARPLLGQGRAPVRGGGGTER